jgi:MAP/microtubule affinity-regulating kinase
LKKFLALNPTKRYTLEQIMKDRWMNLNEDELKPYNEPLVELNDQKIIDQLLQMNFKLADIEESLTKRKFDDIYATYMLMLGGGGRKLSRAKPDSTTSIASGSAAAAASSPQKSETVTNGDGLKETSFMNSKLDEMKTAKHTNDPPSPEIAPNNFKRQHTIGPESLKDRNAIRLHTASGSSRPISATPKVTTERGLQKSPVKPLRAFKPENSLSTAAQTPRRPNINVYKKVEPTKDTPISSRLNAATSNSSSSSSAFARNGPSRYTFHSGQSRMQPREHNTLESKVEAPAFGKGNFLQRLTTRFSKRFRLSQAKATTETSSTKN